MQSLNLILVIRVAAIAFAILIVALEIYIIFFDKSGSDNKQYLALWKSAKAKVISVDQTGTFINNNPQVIIKLRVTPPNSKEYDLDLKHVVKLVDIPKIQSGKIINLKIDPENKQNIELVDLN